MKGFLGLKIWGADERELTAEKEWEGFRYVFK